MWRNVTAIDVDNNGNVEVGEDAHHGIELGESIEVGCVGATHENGVRMIEPSGEAESPQVACDIGRVAFSCLDVHE